MKGAGMFDFAVNVVTMLIGIFLIMRGLAGQTIEPLLLLIMGIIVVIEQLMDVVFHGH